MSQLRLPLGLSRSSVFTLGLFASGCAGVLGLDEFTAGEGGAASTTGLASSSTTTPSSSTGDVTSSSGSGSTSGTGGSGGGEGGAGGEPAGPGIGGGGNTADGGGGNTSTTSDGGGGSGPECADGSVCVPEAPAGWTGPAALYLGETPPETCPAPWNETIAANAGGVTGAHSCAPCACGAPTGAQCSVPQVRVYGDGGCTTTSTLYSLQGNGTCVNTGGGYGARATASAPTEFGTCTRSGGEIAADPIQWDSGAVVCGVTSSPASCGTDGVCAPVAEPPLGASLCVYRDGLQAGCPLDYPERTILHRGANDSRDCTTCSCALPTGVTCPDVVDVFTGSNCTSQSSTLGGTACENEVYYATARFVNRPVGGSCTPTGGAATGEVEATLPMTVCCME